MEIDFGALHIFHTVGTKCSNPKGYNCAFLKVRVLKTRCCLLLLFVVVVGGGGVLT